MNINNSGAQTPGPRHLDEQDITDDPLAECLVHLGKMYHIQVSRTALKAGLPIVADRLTVELFPRAADRAASPDLACRATSTERRYSIGSR